MEQVIRIIDGLLNNQISAAFTYLIVAYLIFALVMLRNAAEGSNAVREHCQLLSSEKDILKS